MSESPTQPVIPTASDQGNGGRRKFVTKAIGILLIAILIATPVAILLMLNSARIYGSEFSPDNFSRRSFTYSHIDWLDWTISKNVHEDITGDTEAHLIASGLIPNVTAPANWHLINDSKTNANSPDFDAQILCDYLDMINHSGNYYWITWSDDNLDLAPSFWSVVVQMARDNAYVGLPTVMRVAMENDGKEKDPFIEKLNRVAGEQYASLGRSDFDLERYERAAIRLDRSLKYRPSDEIKRLLKQAKQKSAPASE